MSPLVRNTRASANDPARQVDALQALVAGLAAIAMARG